MARRQLAWPAQAQGLGEQRPQADHRPPVSPFPPILYLVLQDEVTGLVQWMVMQICLGRKHKQLWQQGIQEKTLPFEGPDVIEAARIRTAYFTFYASLHARYQPGTSHVT